MAAHRLEPRERVRRGAAAELRQPGAAVRRQRGEVELVGADLLAQIGELRELATQRGGAYDRRP